MQEAFNDRTHCFALQLQRILIGAPQAPHVFQIRGGDRQGIIDISRHQYPPLLRLFLLDPLDRRPQFGRRRRLPATLHHVQLPLLRRRPRRVPRCQIADIQRIIRPLRLGRGDPRGPLYVPQRLGGVPVDDGNVSGRPCELQVRYFRLTICRQRGGWRRLRQRCQGEDGRRRQRGTGAGGGQHRDRRRRTGMLLTLGAAKKETSDCFPWQERVRLCYLRNKNKNW